MSRKDLNSPQNSICSSRGAIKVGRAESKKELDEERKICEKIQWLSYHFSPSPSYLSVAIQEGKNSGSSKVLSWPFKALCVENVPVSDDGTRYFNRSSHACHTHNFMSWQKFLNHRIFSCSALYIRCTM